MGLKTQNHNMKYKYYRYAVLVMLVSCKLIRPFHVPLIFYFHLIPVASVLTALILYPVCFAAKLNSGKYFYVVLYVFLVCDFFLFYFFIEYLNLKRGNSI